MVEAPEILVIFLSVFLAIFLLLATILVVLLIKVVNQIKSVTTKAESTLNSISDMAFNVSKVTSPALIAKFIMNKFKNRK